MNHLSVDETFYYTRCLYYTIHAYSRCMYIWLHIYGGQQNLTYFHKKRNLQFTAYNFISLRVFSTISKADIGGFHLVENRVKIFTTTDK